MPEHHETTQPPETLAEALVRQYPGLQADPGDDSLLGQILAAGRNHAA